MFCEFLQDDVCKLGFFAVFFFMINVMVTSSEFLVLRQCCTVISCASAGPFKFATQCSYAVLVIWNI